MAFKQIFKKGDAGLLMLRLEVFFIKIIGKNRTRTYLCLRGHPGRSVVLALYSGSDLQSGSYDKPIAARLWTVAVTEELLGRTVCHLWV